MKNTFEKIYEKLPKHSCSKAETKKAYDLVVKRKEIYEKYIEETKKVDEELKTTDMYIFDGVAYCQMLFELNKTELNKTDF